MKGAGGFSSAMTIAIIVMALMSIGLSLLAKRRKTNFRPRSPIKAKFVLSRNEQPMYFRLVDALPDHIILCQVAFSALLKTRFQATRNTFDRKVADFVICRKSFDVVAIVELDDSSHQGRERQDADRDALLSNAGYKVLRYKNVPDAVTIRADINQ